MKGLLLKDLYIVWDRFKAYFLITIVFWGIQILGDSNLFFICYPCIIMGMVPPNLLSVDESTKWDLFCGTLPCTRAQAVIEKYLIGLTLQTAAAIPTLLLQAGIQLYRGTFVWESYLATACVLVVSALLSSAIVMPLIFKFGAERGQMYQYLTIGIACGGGALLSYVSFEGPADLALPLGAMAAAAAVTVVLYILSWFLSVRFYQTREL